MIFVNNLKLKISTSKSNRSGTLRSRFRASEELSVQRLKIRKSSSLYTVFKRQRCQYQPKRHHMRIRKCCLNIPNWVVKGCENIACTNEFRSNCAVKNDVRARVEGAPLEEAPLEKAQLKCGRWAWSTATLFGHIRNHRQCVLHRTFKLQTVARAEGGYNFELHSLDCTV